MPDKKKEVPLTQNLKEFSQLLFQQI
jgi:hypothetical protein